MVAGAVVSEGVGSIRSLPPPMPSAMPYSLGPLHRQAELTERPVEGGQVTKALGVGQDAVAIEDERAHARPSAPNMWMCSRVMRLTASRTWTKSLGGSAAVGFAVRYSRLASM
jgi:hypothetical protein